MGVVDRICKKKKLGGVLMEDMVVRKSRKQEKCRKIQVLVPSMSESFSSPPLYRVYKYGE